MSEEAKAAQEIAKASDTALKVIRDFGGFIGKYLDGPLSETSGILTDALKVYRFERQAKLLERIGDAIKKRGRSFKSGTIPIKIAIPLLEAGVMEDSECLQKLWAEMFANGVDRNFKGELHRSYIDILQRLTELEAVILDKIYCFPEQLLHFSQILTSRLPAEVSMSSVCIDRALEVHPDTWPSPPPDVSLCLARLSQLGLLRGFGNDWEYKLVATTLIGRSFYNACHPPVAQEGD